MSEYKESYGLPGCLSRISSELYPGKNPRIDKLPTRGEKANEIYFLGEENEKKL